MVFFYSCFNDLKERNDWFVVQLQAWMLCYKVFMVKCVKDRGLT